MTVRPFRASMGRGGGITVSSKASFVQDINDQVSHFIGNYVALVDNVEDQAGQIVYDALKPAFDMSQELVPVDTGDLKGSGYLEIQHVKGNTQVEIGYGRGGFPDYAIPVHEDLEVKHAPPTQAKYLQQPLEQDAPNIQARIFDGFAIVAGFKEGGR